MYAGLVSSIAGGGGSTLFGYVDGVGSVARFHNPVGVSLLSTGDLVIADTTNNIIRRMTSTGMFYVTPLPVFFLFRSDIF